MDWNTIGAQALQIVAPLLLTVLTYAVHAAAKWLKTKTDNEALRGMIDRLDEAVIDAVHSVEQTMVDDIRAATADGVVTKDEADAIKAHAVAAVLDYMGSKGMAQLEKVIDREAIEKMIATKIEAYLHKLKARGGRSTFDDEPALGAHDSEVAPASPSPTDDE